MRPSARRRVKHLLYSRVPGLPLRFRYFGFRLFFPPASVMFRAVCDQGIYESDNLSIMRALALEGSTVFDVGANIGLMSLPLLRMCPTVRVVSFEPSPSTLPYLRRTILESNVGDRWQLIEKGVGRESGVTEFHTSRPGDDAFEGFRATGRALSAAVVRVPVTTLDAEWETLGRPPVSMVKVDVEGAELEALSGARELLRAAKPSLLIEWNARNYAAYGCTATDLLDFADLHRYGVYSVPELSPVETPLVLAAAMATRETFLLAPLG